LWTEKIAPTAKRTWKRVAQRFPRKRASANSDLATAPEIRADYGVFVASTDGVELAISGSTIRMSAAEWLARFKVMLAAGSFKDQQMRILSRARIEETHAIDATPSAPQQLTPMQFAGLVKELFEAHPE